MTAPLRIEIPKPLVYRAAELARECSAATVRERVLVSHAVALAVRAHLEATTPVETEDGRSASPRKKVGGQLVERPV